MAVFMCIYVHYRINKQRDTPFEFSSILSTVGKSTNRKAKKAKFIEIDRLITEPRST